jgi:hypothetical protein
MHTHHHPHGARPLPRLSDDAVVEIQLFIYQFLELFESHYGDQIHRHYGDLTRQNMLDPETHLNLDDPPF